MTYNVKIVTRRRAVKTLAVTPIAMLVAACGNRPATTPAVEAESEDAVGSTASTPASQPTAQSSAGTVLQPTPACGDNDDPTPEQTEGPFYTPDSPERTSLREEGIAGTPLAVTGYVLSTDCTPIAGALLDFWHCDNDGVYDNVGYRLRGHQFADADGHFTLETILPGVYPGRTRHIHVKVQAPNHPVLTTQLYFPNESGNASDGIYNPVLEMTMQETAEGRAGTFNFVIAL